MGPKFRGNTSKGKGSKGSEKKKGRDENAAAWHHPVMSSSGQSVGSEADETVESTESPKRHHVKEQPFSGLDRVAAFSTLFSLGSTAYSQMTSGDSLWGSGVFATGTAWCAFLASFFSTREGIAEVRDVVHRLELASHRLELASQKTQLEKEIKRLETYLEIDDDAPARIKDAEKQIDDINEELFPKASRKATARGYKEIREVYMV